jgi:hypothetical protein
MAVTSAVTEKSVSTHFPRFFMTQTIDGNDVKLLLQGQPNINASLHSKQKPGSVELNGTKIDPSYDPTTRTFVARIRPNALTQSVP